MKIKNVAIIAHVDHGKTTLVDKLLQTSHTFRDNEVIQDRVLDSNDIERERGITILAKNTAIMYKNYKINIVDTPGHADFSGEVERIMNMVDGAILLVDAFEGCMPQTRFVLKKALEANVVPIVVVNKVDREFSRPEEVADEVLDLFIELGADDTQIEFPVIYASGLNGVCSKTPDLTGKIDMTDLLDQIIETIPDASDNIDAPLLFQPSLLDYNEYVGRMGIGRIHQGVLKVNQMVNLVDLDGNDKQYRIQKLYTFLGLKKVEVSEAYAGDICAIAGIPYINVGETVCEVGRHDILPRLRVEEPTVEMTFGVNTSPLAGEEGSLVTSTKIEERLNRECEKDVSLKVERIGQKEEWIVKGRGELHLSILIENMRREGFEFQVSRPQVIIKEIDGVRMEPFESLVIDTPTDYLGGVIDLVNSKGGVIVGMNTIGNQTKLDYVCPSRGLIGFNTDFMTVSKGYGILAHSFLEYRKVESINVGERKLGALVSVAQGLTTAYSLGSVEERGTLFVEPRVKVYEGMIIGVANKELDVTVNCTKEKAQTNTRSSNKDTTVVLKRPRILSLEACLEFINSDELVEITPKSIRLRKLILGTEERKKYNYKKEKEELL